MRLAILISLAALSLGAPALRGDDAFVQCEVGPHGGYLVPASYAEAHRADIMATLPDEPEVTGFWTVTEQIAIVADRSLRIYLEDSEKNPAQLFPDLTVGGDASLPDSLGYQVNELKLIVEHYGAYSRQYVGMEIGGDRIVLLNYAVAPRLDPSSGYLFIHRVFEPGQMHFLNARFDWDQKIVSNVSMYGAWQDVKN